MGERHRRWTSPPAGTIVEQVGRGVAPLSIQVATDLEVSLVALMNAERSAAGLAPLKIEAHLNASAQSHSDWMAATGTLSHTGAGGSSVKDRVEDEGFPLEGSWRTTENLAFTTTTGDLDDGEVRAMHDGLMDSPGHRANILDPDVSYVGVGLSIGEIEAGGQDREAVFLTQNFAETEGRVLVQEEEAGETVLQEYEDGAAVGEPEYVDQPPPEEEDDRDARDREDEDEDDGGGSGSGGACFVATAAYGSHWHPDVRVLRRFRDKVLVGHGAGRAFVRAYGILGPRLARVVSHDRVSGRVARAVIAPLARLAGAWLDRRRRHRRSR
jgi:uncharacterized protein YkwD